MPIRMQFVLEGEDTKSGARAGHLDLPHGRVDTPVFMPVGTAGTVKGLHQRELSDEINARMILGNTYHLYLRPGEKLLAEAGGLHGFMGWDRALLTDSGGYQVYSLADARKITEEGVRFRSHIDGSAHFFSPESVVDTQRIIGADIMMAFDECPPYPSTRAYAENSMHLTHRWLDRCIEQYQRTENPHGHDQALFPIVQGGAYSDLRKASSAYAADKDMPGYAIGGLSVGEPHEIMYEMAATCCSVLPAHKPRYLMGVGTPENILEAIGLGIDMFDCVMPTRNGRNGMLFTTQGIINIRNEQWKNDLSPLDDELDNTVSNRYSKAYLRHLIISKEMLGAQIASKHNIFFYTWLVKEARKHIMKGAYCRWKDNTIAAIRRRL